MPKVELSKEEARALINATNNISSNYFKKSNKQEKLELEVAIMKLEKVA